MYAMTSTIPDTCHAVRLVSRYQANPGKEHCQVMKRIFKYFQENKYIKLCFWFAKFEINRLFRCWFC